MEDDPFQVLGLPRRFDLDPAAVERAWLRRSAGLHPDRVADPAAQAEAVRRAARVNAARAVLVDDERRADALLRLLGGPAREEDNALPDGFLVEIMEVREAMAEALASGGAGERERFERWADERREALRDEVARLFAGFDPPGAATLGAIRTRLNAWRYIERMIEQLDPAHHGGS